MITKPFFLAKDNYRIGAKILRGNKILRDAGTIRSIRHTDNLWHSGPVAVIDRV
jgi:hypothetical protein